MIILTEKITKNVISRKVKEFEQSYLDARFTAREITLKAPQRKGWEFKILKKKNLFGFSEIKKKNHKKRHISKTTRNGALIFGGKIRNS